MTPKDRRPSLRARLADLFRPYHGDEVFPRLNLIVDIVILVAIVASVILIPLEHYYPEHRKILWHLEVAFALFFAAEYLLRWYASKKPWRYPFSGFAIIDLLAFLPTLILLSSQAMALPFIRGIRVLRLFRLVRLLRLFRYGFLLHHVVLSVRIGASALTHTYRLRHLGRLFLWLFAAWVSSANIIYITEKKFAAKPGPFADYWTSYWNTIIALFSGIEDKEPLSFLGRMEMTLLLLIGILVVGMFTAEIVSIIVRKADRAGKLALKPPRAHFERHILILGENSHLENVVRQVSAAYRFNPHIVVVSPVADELKIQERQLYRKVFAVPGDPVDLRVLEDADVDAASRVIVLASDHPDGRSPMELDSSALMQTLAIVARRRDNPPPIVVELQSEESLNVAGPLAGIDFLVGRHYGEKLISQAVLSPGITDIFVRLMTFTDESNEFYLVPVPEFLRGKTFCEAQLHFLDQDDEDIVLVGIDRSPPHAPATHFTLNPLAHNAGLKESERRLRDEDLLVIIAYARPSFASVSQGDRWTGRHIDRS